MDGPHGKDLGMSGGLEERTERNGTHREANGVNMDHEGKRNMEETSGLPERSDSGD